MASKMASNDGKPKCPVCLEAPPSVMASTTCNHFVCKNCLSTHLEKIGAAAKHFPCPTCRVECPLPVDGLPDCNGASDSTAREPSTDVELEGAEEGGGVQCQICYYTKDTFAAADHICGECQNLHICNECTLAHSSYKTTAHHRPIPFKAKKVSQGGRCKKHKLWITSYCCTCSDPVCPACVHIDHSEHSIENLADVFNDKVKLIRDELAEGENRSRYLDACEKELNCLKSKATKRHDTMVAAVEDQAEKYINDIIQQKETIKKQLKTDFRDIFEVTDCVDMILVLNARLKEFVAMSEKMLPNVEQCPSDLVKLSALRLEIEEIEKLTKVINNAEYWQSFLNEWKSLPVLSGGATACLGSLITSPKNVKDIEKAQLIFEKYLGVDASDTFIPCIVALGEEFYAVAQPISEGISFDAVDIYKYPGVFQRTLREDINPANAMASTPGGNLAVLSDGRTGDSCSVGLFDPETGNLISTRDLAVQGWLGFDVNLLDQFVVLSDDGGRKVTIFNDDGSVESTHAVDVSDYYMKDTAHRIVCSWRFIYVAGPKGFAIYEGSGMDLVLTSPGGMGGVQIIDDIKVNSVLDEVCFCCRVDNHQWGIVMYTFHNQELNNRSIRFCWFNAPSESKAFKETRVSVTDKYVVASLGDVLMVYAL